MKVLVTGGAGYVGSLVCEALVDQGCEVMVLDNLQQGHRDSVPEKVEFVRADIRYPDEVRQVFLRHAIDGVMHMAADSLVELSMTDPGRFFRNNICGGLNLLETMVEHKVNRIIFSSSAAVYGTPDVSLIEETEPTVPVNPYGESKLIFERILKWYGEAYGLKHVSLRYFNASGASKKRGEDHRPETHLIPNILKAAFNNAATLNIFGTDYPTKDGTCVRDYVHVSDIAFAHILALEKIDHLNSDVYNLGNGEGYSVREVIDAAKRVTGANIAIRTCTRREGDPPALVASSALARRELGWMPKYNSIESIVETSWKWLKRYPEGYAH